MFNLFAIDVSFTLLLSGGLLYHYSDWFRHRLGVTLSVLTAWYFSFLFIFVIPMDVSNTLYRQCLHDHPVVFGENSNMIEMLNSSLTEANIHNVTLSTFSTNISRKHENVDLFELTDSDNVSMTSVFCKSPYNLLDENTLPNLWKIVYWSSQILTWLFLPIMQSYAQAGEFSFVGKLKAAFWDNFIIYISFALIAIIILMYIALSPSISFSQVHFRSIASSASNTWGLIVVVFLLGYGLVEVPRDLWIRSKSAVCLRRAYFHAAKLIAEKSDAEESLDEIIVSLTLAKESSFVDQDPLLAKYVETMVKKIPLEIFDRVQQRRRRRQCTSSMDDDSCTAPTVATLVSMHRKIIQCMQAYKRTEVQWTNLTDSIFNLEDLNKNMSSTERLFRKTSVTNNGSSHLSILARTVYNEKVEWYWKCLMRPLLFQCLSFLACFFSILLIWSEISFFCVSPPLSVFAVGLKWAQSYQNYYVVEFICVVTLCYLCLCTYYTVFRIRILNYYYLASNHQSDEVSLLLSGTILSRITPPLCFNFICLIHMDSHILKSRIMETSFTQVMGHLDVLSIISDYFNVYFPIAILVLTAATYFSIGTKLLSVMDFHQFVDNDADITQELVEEGREHVKREKRRRHCMNETINRRREFSRFETAGFSNTDTTLTPGANRFLPPKQTPPGPLVKIDNVPSDLSKEEIEPSLNRNPPRNIFDDI